MFLCRFVITTFVALTNVLGHLSFTLYHSSLLFIVNLQTLVKLHLKGQCIGMEAMQSWWFHCQWNHNETKGLHVHTVDSRCHTRSTWKTRPQKYTERWSSENKRIWVLTKHLSSGESYELTRVKVFDKRLSSMVKGQNEMLANALTMDLQRGRTPK